MIGRLLKSELEILVAVASSWRARGRAPGTREMVRLTGRVQPSAARDRLIAKGLLTMDWRDGVPLLGSLRPTARGWSEIDGASPPLPDELPTAAE